MKPIELLYAKNIVSRVTGVTEQELAFALLVQNLAYKKLVEIHWAGEDGIWQVLKAEYRYSLGQDRELWRADIKFRLSSSRPFPGNIRFALRLRVSGREYWDNNHSKDYFIERDSGVLIQDGISILDLGCCNELQRGQISYPVTVAVRRSLPSKYVSIHWTTDNWKTRHRTPCFSRRDYWRTLRSNAGSPNKYGWEIWMGEIPVGDAFRLEYALSCDTPKQRIWDNNFGKNYSSRRESLKILTLNLHCYQEDRQEEKFNQIAKAISDLKVDIVCLQEVAENWNDGRGDWKSNSARIIRERLKKFHHASYHLHTDWSHIGFGKYREGTAILSRYKLLARDSGYVSRSRDPLNIHARRVVMAQVHVPYMGLVNVFSVHLSWWSDGFREQFVNLRRWANLRHTEGIAATFLCGDFNSKAGSSGYGLVADTKEYDDEFLKAVSPDTFDKVSKRPLRELEGLFANDQRIDYIFLKKGSTLKVTSARALFTEHDYGWVSDHCGYVAEFELE